MILLGFIFCGYVGYVMKHDAEWQREYIRVIEEVR